MSDGSIQQQASYDSEGNRWLRITSDTGGKALLTLRDANGQVAVDYEVTGPGESPEPVKDYVRAAGGLVAIGSTCGPRPNLGLGDPRKLGTDYMFQKFDQIPPEGDYTILIESESGLSKTLTEPNTLPDTFGIDESEFFPNENNWVRIQTQAECGATGYSNAVSVHIEPGNGCLDQIGGMRSGFDDNGGSDLFVELLDPASNCDPGTLFYSYYQPEGSPNVYCLVADPVPLAQIQIQDQPAGAGHGRYWFTAVDPVTLEESAPGPAIIDDVRNTTMNSTPMSSPTSKNYQYVHRDHLGSTRLQTDEHGAEIGRWKYYPFGMEATSASGSDQRMKFTGHERDVSVQLDYMLARYYGANLGRFLSVDPVNGVAKSPQSWNRYAYARNSPLRFIDPTGMTDEQALQTMESLQDPDVQTEMATAMEDAGYDEANPSATQEAVGGIGEVVEDGQLSGDFVATSTVQPDATPSEATPMTAGEIAQSTGAAPVAGFHTHQLAGRNAKPEKKQGAQPSGHDKNTAKKLGRPELVVSRNQVWMAWTNDKGKVKTGKVMSFDSVDALKSGNVTMHTPKPLRNKTP